MHFRISIYFAVFFCAVFFLSSPYFWYALQVVWKTWKKKKNADNTNYVEEKKPKQLFDKR